MILFLLAISVIAANADFKCNFDQDKCGFVNDQWPWSDIPWKRLSGSTLTPGTGPSADHTSGKGSYMYMEATGANYLELAAMRKQGVKFTGNTCVTFWYHMYGQGLDYLDVAVNDVRYFSKNGNQGNKWHKASFRVTAIGTFEVIFEAYRGTTYKSDIAVDDIHIGPCSGSGTPAPPTGAPTPPPPTNAPTPLPPTGGPTPPPPTGTVATPKPGSCGLKPAVRIVGGTDAKPGDWPWQAALMYKDGISPFCGGTLVHPQWVVTATHCLEGETAGAMKVRLGGHATKQTNANAQDIDVAKIIRHPSYEKPINMAYDLSLLKLSKPAVLNKFVNLACLPESIADPTEGTKCYTTGWGRMASGGTPPNVLQQVSVPIVGKVRCNRAYPNEIHDSMICAGYDAGGKDSCQGDSGGPLVCQSGGRYYLHGATSWGKGCAAKGKFGVYARVKYLMSWIKNIMATH